MQVGGFRVLLETMVGLQFNFATTVDKFSPKYI